MSKRTENKYLAVAVKVDGEEVMARIRPFGGDRDMTTIHTADDGWQFAEVEFKSTISESEFCVCDACHKTGEVMKLTLPETSYRRNGQLTTKHREYWLCPPCRRKLVHALDWPEQTTKSDFEKQIETEQKYYHGCYSQTHIWGMPEEFNSCPVCGKTDHMRVTAQKRFDEACHECGYIIKIECSRCMLAVNEYSFEPRDYWDMRADLRQKWNRLGNRRTENDRD